MRRLVEDQQGMTIMEVMIATSIMGIGLWALSAAIPIAIFGIQEGNQRSTATFLANQRLEQVRNADWEAGPPCLDKLGVSASSTAAPVETCANVMTTFPDEIPIDDPPTTYAGYNRTVRIFQCVETTPCNGIEDGNLRQVTVSVAYSGMNTQGLYEVTGPRKVVTVTMYIAKR